MSYSQIFTSDGSGLFTIDGSPIVIFIADPLVITECVGDITVVTPINQSIPVTWGNPTATGGLPPYSYSFSVAPGSLFPAGTTVVTAIVTDAQGSIVNCTFNVTITILGGSSCVSGLSNGTASSSTCVGGLSNEFILP